MSKYKQVGDYSVNQETGERTFSPESNPNRRRRVTRNGVTQTIYLSPHAYSETGRDMYPDT